MKDLNDLAAQVVTDDSLSRVLDMREACPTCQRGARQLPMPTLDHLDAIISIREGFDRYRRNFTPEMTERIDRFNYVISYLHAMIAGTVPPSSGS